MSGLVQLAPGSVFAGDFEVIRPLTAGGMGAVYVVEQRSTGKHRALKIMAPQLVHDPQMRERFVMEAKIGARIESDHVVEVVSAGVDAASGVPWLAMELLSGETLGQRVTERGPLPHDEVAEIVSQLCHALGAAHSAGIVHRDLKPENIFLSVPRRQGTAFVVKVLDFGIAKLVADAGSRSTAAIGSPLWMAPEQASTEGVIRPSTDVWALGLLVFWMLTGMEYWKAAHAAVRNPMALLLEAAVHPIDSATRRAVHYMRADHLPAGFDLWFWHCVVRDPDARFRDAHEARIALDRLFHAEARAREEQTRPAGSGVDNEAVAGGEGAPAKVAPAKVVLGAEDFDPKLAPTTVGVPELDIPAPQPTTAIVAKLALAAPAISAKGDEKRTPANATDEPGAAEGVAAANDLSPDGYPAVLPVIQPSTARVSAPGTLRAKSSAATTPRARERPMLDVERPSAAGTRTTGAAARMRRAQREEEEAAAHRPIQWRRIAIGAGVVVVLLAVAQRLLVTGTIPGFKTSAAGVGAEPRAAMLPAPPPAPAATKCPSGMALVPGGAHVDPFCMDASEVTVKAYVACVKSKKCTAAHATAKWQEVGLEASALAASACNGGHADRQEHPITCVDAVQAQAFCAADGRLLPTDAQWEWAAHGGAKQSSYPWGDDLPSTQLCWSHISPRVGTCVVGSHTDGDNPQSVHDLQGNVREWTASSLADDHERVVCGADWTDARASVRGLGACGPVPNLNRSPFVGFRCVTAPTL